ncbi:MAG: SDR family NAD(P)-dependent oxidoreductase, partial [Candidatus Solibacter sp.]
MAVKLTNQVVLVVGASSGIGRATAVLFAREGARVMAAARREERLRTLQQEMAAEGASLEFAIADVSKVEDMEALVKQTEERLGPIDILVYNSGTNIKDRALANLTPP